MRSKFVRSSALHQPVETPATMTRLSVNVNKIAVLRNSRGGALPSVVEAADCAVAAGAQGITVHPRPDCRHIRPEDAFDLGDP